MIVKKYTYIKADLETKMFNSLSVFIILYNIIKCIYLNSMNTVQRENHYNSKKNEIIRQNKSKRSSR